MFHFISVYSFFFHTQFYCISPLQLKAYQDWAEVVKTNDSPTAYNNLSKKMLEIQNQIEIATSLSQESSSSTSAPDDQDEPVLTTSELEMLESGTFNISFNHVTLWVVITFRNALRVVS